MISEVIVVNRVIISWHRRVSAILTISCIDHWHCSLHFTDIFISYRVSQNKIGFRKASWAASKWVFSILKRFIGSWSFRTFAGLPQIVLYKLRSYSKRIWNGQIPPYSQFYFGTPCIYKMTQFTSDNRIWPLVSEESVCISTVPSDVVMFPSKIWGYYQQTWRQTVK